MTLTQKLNSPIKKGIPVIKGTLTGCIAGILSFSAYNLAKNLDSETKIINDIYSRPNIHTMEGRIEARIDIYKEITDPHITLDKFLFPIVLTIPIITALAVGRYYNSKNFSR